MLCVYMWSICAHMKFLLSFVTRFHFPSSGFGHFIFHILLFMPTPRKDGFMRGQLGSFLSVVIGAY